MGTRPRNAASVDWASAAEEAELTFEADDPNANLEASVSR